MTKVQLSELTEKDVENLLDNSKVWEKAIEAIEGQVTLLLNDFISALKGLGRYGISDSSNYNNCLPVANSYDFLGSLDYACGFYAVALSDEQINKANKLVSDYLDSETDEQQDQLENAMDSLANEYAEILLKSMVAEYDVIYNKDYVKDFMFDGLESLYNDGAFYDREDNSIYYMVKD